MKLYIKQKVFSWVDRFTVFDETGADKYYVEGEFFSWGKKLHVTDLTGRETAFIQQKVFSMMPRFFVYMDGVERAEIVKRFTFFFEKYEIEGLDWTIEGDFWAHEYRITQNGREVVSISKVVHMGRLLSAGHCRFRRRNTCAGGRPRNRRSARAGERGSGFDLKGNDMIEINQDFADGVLHSRNPETNKNDYGRILCVCGSAGYTGAAYFSAQGAVRMGSGVVTLAVPQGAWPVLAVKLNEPVVRPMPQDENGLFSMDALPKLLALAEKADALLIGCGLGRSDTLTEIVCTLLEKAACQIVLDADGINSITGHKDILRRTAKPVVLTPHAGEFARLSGKPDATAADAAQFAQDYRCIVLYKGHRTRIFTPDGGCYRNTSGNPGMAKGGSGDVLAGMLVSLCGQGIDAIPAACTAAWLHGRAGDLAANALSEYGMTPSDMLTQLPILLKRYNSKTW